MDKKIKTALVVLIVAACATAVSVIIEDRSIHTPENVLEMLHSTIENGYVEETDNTTSQVESYAKNLTTNSVYDIVELEKNQTIEFAAGSTAIVTIGHATAICLNDNLVDITMGGVLEDGMEIMHNHLYVVQTEGTGLAAKDRVRVLNKGGYQINTGKE